jgi:hypothetical protein
VVSWAGVEALAICHTAPIDFLSFHCLVKFLHK